MKKKKFIPIYAAIFLVFVIGAYLGYRSATKPNSGVPIPVLPTEDYTEPVEYEFSTDFRFPVETEMDLYQMVADETVNVLGQVEQALGIMDLTEYILPGEYNEFGQVYRIDEKHLTVTVDENSGWWTSIADESTYEESAETVITRQGLILLPDPTDVARAYIRDNVLFEGNLGAPNLTLQNIRRNEKGEQFADMHVSFSPRINGKVVFGDYGITIAVGDNGETLDVYKQAGLVEPVQFVVLKTEEELRTEVHNQPESISLYLSAPLDIWDKLRPEQLESMPAYRKEITKGIIEDCQLAYYVDSIPVKGKIYAYPVYSITGTGYSATGEIKFLFLIDAVKR